MKARNRPILLLAALAAAVYLAPCAAQEAAAKGAGAKAIPGFSVEGGNYSAVGEGLGADAAEAQEKARGAALGILFRGLGKDRLFAEVFIGSPPVGMSFDLLSSTPEGGKIRAKVVVKVDDESVRIVERGPYLAAAVALLDKAEKSAAEAETRAAQGTTAEAEARLGEALVAYGMADDAARSGLALIEGLGDASIFSGQGKRTAPELRRVLGTVRDSVAAGIERVRSAQAALEADETGKAVGESVVRAVQAAEHADALLAEQQGILADPSAVDAERLRPLREKLALERRSIDDAEADLGRAKAALPKDRQYRSDELEFARRRLATADAALASAYRSVDREIRDPAARRAARARTFRWALFHEPDEYLSIRAYLPMAIRPEEEQAFGFVAPDGVFGAEGAFPFGRGGIWTRTRIASSSLSLSAQDEFGLRQSFDLGIWSKVLFFASYSWDWYRGFAGERVPQPGRIGIGIGGGPSLEADEGPRRPDWLLGLSYQLPYADQGELSFWKAFNAGLETQFRLGRVAILEASASERLHRLPDGSLDLVFAYALGFGIRVPKPFLLGFEYGGTLVWPLLEAGGLGDVEGDEGGAFRVYVGYSL